MTAGGRDVVTRPGYLICFLRRVQKLAIAWHDLKAIWHDFALVCHDLSPHLARPLSRWHNSKKTAHAPIMRKSGEGRNRRYACYSPRRHRRFSVALCGGLRMVV